MKRPIQILTTLVATLLLSSCYDSRPVQNVPEPARFTESISVDDGGGGIKGAWDTIRDRSLFGIGLTRNKDTGQVYFPLWFKWIPKPDVLEEGEPPYLEPIGDK